MATTNRSRIHRLALATLALSIAWMTTVGADNLDRQVSFDVPGAPLASSMAWNAPAKLDRKSVV